MLKFFELEIGRERVFGLDILRAIAILTVVFAHGYEILRAPVFTYFFIDGVGIFFVLSGFLIGGILIKIVDKNEALTFGLLINFWARRWFRTLPNYFLVLFIAGLFVIWVDRQFTLEGFVSFFTNIKRYYFFIQNFATAPPLFFRESWSLSVEEWFYLLIPFFVFTLIMFTKAPKRFALLAVCGAVTAMAIGLRWYQFVNMVPTKENYSLLIHWQVVKRLDSIVLGVIGAYVYYYHTAFWIRIKNAAFAIGLSIFVIHHIVYSIGDAPVSFFYSVFSTTVFGASVLFTIPYLSQVRMGSGFIYRFITYTSLISYSMYLLNYTIISHHIVQKIYLGPGTGGAIGKYGLFWIMTFALSMVLYKYYEKPMMELREKRYGMLQKKP